jgi:hypothetical protein
MDLEFAGAVIALLAAMFAGLSWNSAARAAKHSLAASEVAAEKALAVSRAQNDLARLDMSLRWAVEVTGWSSEVISALSDAVYAAEDGLGSQPEIVAKVCRPRLSALIERGRLLFPNQRKSEHGLDKHPAYRGYRHAVLDPIVAAERACAGDTGAFSNTSDAVLEMRRRFVSAIEEILEWEAKAIEIEALIKRTADRKAEFGSTIPRGATPLLLAGRGSQDAHKPMRRDVRGESSSLTIG